MMWGEGRPGQNHITAVHRFTLAFSSFPIPTECTLYTTRPPSSAQNLLFSHSARISIDVPDTLLACYVIAQVAGGTTSMG